MIPILMQNDTVVGFLADAFSCVVTEERNGVFELSLTYPVTGGLFSELQIDRLVKAKPNDTADLQLFRVYEVSKPMNGIVTVNAEHVSYALASYTCLDAGPSEFRVYTVSTSARESTERFSVTSSLLRVDVTSRIALYANMANDDGGYITIEKGKMELCDGTNYRTLANICSAISTASSNASSALSKANDAYNWADVNSSNIDTLWSNVLWKNGDCSVDCIRFNGGDIAFQVYNGALSFGIAAKPMDFWATRYNFVNDDVRIGGTSLKQWIKNNLTPKSGGGWA